MCEFNQLFHLETEDGGEEMDGVSSRMLPCLQRASIWSVEGWAGRVELSTSARRQLPIPLLAEARRAGYLTHISVKLLSTSISEIKHRAWKAPLLVCRSKFSVYSVPCQCLVLLPSRQQDTLCPTHWLTNILQTCFPL